MKKKVNFKSLFTSLAFWRRIGMAVMLVMILIRPTLSGGNSPRKEINLNIWFVADATGSMVAKDIDNGSTRRYEKASKDMESIVKQIPGAKYALIVQDYYSYTASPLSTSADAIISASGYLMPKNSLDAQPTNLADLLSFSSDAIAKNHERSPDRINAMVFMSDGEDLSGATTEVPDSLAKVVKNSIVLGYGTKEGKAVEKVGISGDTWDDSRPNEINPDECWKYFYKDGKYDTDSNDCVVSKIHESNLQSIATSISGSYFHRESGDVPSEIINALKKGTSLINSESASDVNSRLEIYWIFALILLVLVFWEGAEILTRILNEREVNHA